MSHPFELSISDLKAANLEHQLTDFLTDEEQEKVHGGTTKFTTELAVTAGQGEAGEEGGGSPITEYVTARLGEVGEGGGGSPIATTNYATVQRGEAGEEGGGSPIATTQYITARLGEAAEEGGGLYV